jgi:hypothetical protein
MTTHSVRNPLVGVAPLPRNLPRTHRAWLAFSVAVVAALVAAALPRATALPPAETSTSPTSLDAPTGLVKSFGLRRSHNSRYSAEVIDASPVAVGVPATWTVHFSHRADRIAHATVQARVWMPETTESSPAPTRIRYVGDGNYRIENVLFARAGWWNVSLVLEGRRGTDSVAFNVIIPPQSPDTTRPVDRLAGAPFITMPGIPVIGRCAESCCAQTGTAHNMLSASATPLAVHRRGPMGCILEPVI